MDYFNYFNNLDMYEKDSKFFVNGQIGNWRKSFNHEMSNRFDEVISKNLKYKGFIDYGTEEEFNNKKQPFNLEF